ncbi:putative ribonuclease H2 subunit B [Helianthus anomalus]
MGDYICKGKFTKNVDLTRTLFHVKIPITICYVSADGGLYAATLVDPNGNDIGKFRQLDEITYIHDYPGYRCLSTIAESSMQIRLDLQSFFRLNDSKVLAWMLSKVKQLKQTFVKLDKNYAARSEKEICMVYETCLCARACVFEYLADDPWCKVLCDNLRLNMVKAVDVSDMKIDLVDTSTPSSFTPTIQEQTTNDKRVTRSAKPNKKAKVETNSHSIKDIFSRASRMGK